MKVKDLFVTHLLFPIISFLLVSIMLFINKKNTLLSNKELILFVLISSLVIAIAGVSSLAGIAFMPYYYVGIQVLFLVLGYFYMNAALQYFSGKDESINQLMIILSTIAVLCLGSYLFALAFNFLGEFHYGIVASTCTYTLVIPILFHWCYKALLNIPSEIYKIWKYNPKYQDPNFTSETVDKIAVLELELSKSPEDTEYVKVKAKAPTNFVFGDWFQMFIHDYNIKYLESPIRYQQSNGAIDGWIFYTKPSLLNGKKIVDFEKTIEENGLSESSHSIVCKRVDKIQL